MKILKIEIEEFGRLTDFVLEPGAGITLIEGENESGKSTLLAFLRFALYGFPRRGGPDGDEREKRLSWRSRCAAGRVELERDGVCHRITRRCVARGSSARESFSEELAVIRLPEGEAVELGGKTPGEYFLGLPAELYDGSLCLVQSDADRVSAPGMGEAVGDHLFTGEAAFSAEGAEARLRQARRDLQHLKGRGGRIAELEDALSALDEALGRARADEARLADLRADIKRYRGQIEEKQGELAGVRAALECADIDRALALFDDLARARAEEQSCGVALDAAREEAARTLPDRELSARVELVLRDCSMAQEQVARLVPEVDRLSKVRHDEKLLRGAEKLREQGGAEVLLGAITQKEKKAKGQCLTGVILLVLTAVAVLLAILLPVYRLYVGVGGAVSLLLALVALLGALGIRRKRKRLLHGLGASDTPMLRTYFEQCKREEETHFAHQGRLLAVEQELALARSREAAAKGRLRDAFSSIGHGELADSIETAERFLEAVTRRKGELQAAISDATIALERARSLTETLSRRLQGVDEEALRARRAAAPSVVEDLNTLKEKRILLERSVADLEQKRAEAERAESALAATARDPVMLERERLAAAEQLEGARRRLAAIRMALEALARASEDLRRGLTPKLRKETARLFRELTDGVHGELHLGADLSMTLEGEGMPRAIVHFSAGCRDAAHLSLRLSLLGTLSKERLPLLFDEAFARLDDTRARNLLAVLQSYCRGGGQCLLLTCHKREGELLSGDTSVKRVIISKNL